jgi:hypothetical protein
MLLHDGARMKGIGVEAWVLEQEERKRNGFDYGLIRCGKCDIPLENDHK